MRYKRPVVSAIAAVLGIMLMLLDLWTLIAVKASVYRLWPGRARTHLTDPWLWFGAIPVVALFLICTAYWFGRDRHTPDPPKPVQLDERDAGSTAKSANDTVRVEAGKPKVLSGR